MGSKRSKIFKRSKISRTDRISDLPDLVLIKILSFLPLNSAVCTSTLSKRWTPLCKSLPNLHFDDSYGKKSRPYLDQLDIEKDLDLECARSHFISRVDKFLMDRNINLAIDEFGLKCVEDYDLTLVNTWIRKALDHNVKCMTLGFRFRSLYELIPDMYTYGRFEVLRLNSNILVDFPSHFCFPRLKVLEFYFVTFSSYESVQNLLLNCPVLEDLVMKRCEYLSGSCLTVCGSALKNLTLKTDDRIDTESKLEIVIDTPALETLRIGDSALADFFVKDTLLSLRTAHINVGIERLMLRDSVFRLLDNIFHVKHLILKDKAVGALNGKSGYELFRNLDRGSVYKFPIFHNLIKLELHVDNWSCWNLLPKILASSPNLQTLLLPWGVDLDHTSQGHDYCLWHSPSLIPECLSSNLKTIELRAFHGTDDEMSLAEYLLLYGKALQKISIDLSEAQRKSRIRKELLRLSKGSKTCKINFIN